MYIFNEKKFNLKINACGGDGGGGGGGAGGDGFGGIPDRDLGPGVASIGDMARGLDPGRAGFTRASTNAAVDKALSTFFDPIDNAPTRPADMTSDFKGTAGPIDGSVSTTPTSTPATTSTTTGFKPPETLEEGIQLIKDIKDDPVKTGAKILGIDVPESVFTGAGIGGSIFGPFGAFVGAGIGYLASQDSLKDTTFDDPSVGGGGQLDVSKPSLSFQAGDQELTPKKKEPEPKKKLDKPTAPAPAINTNFNTNENNIFQDFRRRVGFLNMRLTDPFGVGTARTRRPRLF